MKAYLDLINQMNLALVKRDVFFVCKKSKLNIALLKLLLNEGLILSFYQYKLKKNNLCVFLKYWNNKPVILKIQNVKVKGISYTKCQQLLGDLQTDNLFIVSTSLGGLVLLNKRSIESTLWLNRFGGDILFKLII